MDEENRGLGYFSAQNFEASEGQEQIEKGYIYELANTKPKHDF